MPYTGGGYENLKHYQSNSAFSSKLTAIILSVVGIIVLYIIVRVIFSFQKDKRLVRRENERKQKYIDKILGRKSKSENNKP